VKFNILKSIKLVKLLLLKDYAKYQLIK